MYDNCSAGGMGLSGSDVCKTPPMGTPIAYSNQAQLSNAIPNVPNMFISGGNAHNGNTEVPTTTGDEAGSQLGVASGTVSSKSKNIKGSMKVFIQGSFVTRLTDTTVPNSQNTVGTNIEPSQEIVMTLS